MTKVIIGIHGLANKPKPKTLEDWWEKSIREGLANVGMTNARFDFKIVFWADLLYKNLLHDDAAYHFDGLYNEEPYRTASSGGLREYKDGWLDNIRATVLDVGGSVLDTARQKLNLTRVSEWFLGKLLRDLAFYYDDERKIAGRGEATGSAREVLDEELRRALVSQTGKEIMVVAHSMGSIIAYNVLRRLGRENPDCKVREFITIGSPLGLPYVKAKIVDEHDYDPSVRTPSCVTGRWRNYADRNDPVALDVHLRDDYASNDEGVRVEDDLILNDYHTVNADGKVKRNAHKSYGYLRCPELSRHVKDFLAG